MRVWRRRLVEGRYRCCMLAPSLRGGLRSSLTAFVAIEYARYSYQVYRHAQLRIDLDVERLLSC